MSDLHSINRTSLKGEAFVGTCVKCGKTGLTLKDMQSECDNPSRMTQDEALLAAILPSSKLGYATQKTGQSAENAEGAGSSPAGVDALTAELAEALALVASGQGWLYARDLNYFSLADEAIVGVLRHYSPAVQAAGVSDGNLITELVGALKQLLAARKDTELMQAAIVAEAAIARAEGRS